MFTYLRFCSNVKKRDFGFWTVSWTKTTTSEKSFLQFKDTSKEKEKINQINAECLIILYK